MKQLLFALWVIIFIITGCKKEPVIRQRPSVVQLPPPPPTDVNTAPEVNAGDSIEVYLPADSAFLSGSAADAENNIISYSWRQLSGPSQASIQFPKLSKTKISRLVKGAYRFELTVTDSGNLSGKAAVHVLVIDTLYEGANKIIFRDLYAGCWGGECLLVMDGSSIPQNIPLTVLFKSEDSITWMEVPKQLYNFSTTDKFFRIQFGGDETHEAKKWEVMIVY